MKQYQETVVTDLGEKSREEDILGRKTNMKVRNETKELGLSGARWKAGYQLTYLGDRPPKVPPVRAVIAHTTCGVKGR